jgi:PDGLE domain-containing protein
MNPMAATRYKRLWLGVWLLVLLCPLGIILPEKFNAGAAWGEWGADELKLMLGYVPEKLEKWQGVWKAVFPKYEINGIHKPWQAKLAYVLSGIIGVTIVAGICYGLGKWLSAEDREEHHAP